jgi:hypothetical protein
MYNIMYAVNGIPVNCYPGMIVAYPSNTIPSGWALCDGSSYNTSDNPLLYQALESPVLPNLKGAYLRGIGTAGSGAYTAPLLKEFHNDKLKGHTHTVNDPEHFHVYTYYTRWGSTNDGGTRMSTDLDSLDTGRQYTGITINDNGTETRPSTYVINWIIKLG